MNFHWTVAVTRANMPSWHGNYPTPITTIRLFCDGNEIEHQKYQGHMNGQQARDAAETLKDRVVAAVRAIKT